MVAAHWMDVVKVSAFKEAPLELANVSVGARSLLKITPNAPNVCIMLER